MKHRNVISRRDALRYLSASTLLSLGLWPGALAAADATGEKPFRFLVVNDTHYMTPECGTYLENVVKQMKTHEGPEFCLHLGDLVEKGERTHIAAVRDVFKGLPIPFYTQIGNHDYFTQTDRKSYEEMFPKRLNYFFENRGWQFVGFDSSDGLRYEKTAISQETLNWIDGQLPRLDKKKPLVLFTHFPLGEKVQYRPSNTEVFLERFLPFNLKGTFSGHFHGFTERTFRDVKLTTNRCCALKRGNHDNTKEKGYFLCTADETGLKREFIEFKTPQAKTA